MAKSKLNARQAEFVRHFTAGADGVRGNAKAAYLAAGYIARGNSAEVAAARLFRHVQVQEAIQAAHAKAEESAASKLRDWKDLAPAAQERIEHLGRGALPDGADPASVPATVMLAANREIVERGYPSKQVMDHNHRIEGRLHVSVIYEDRKPDQGSEGAAS